jgi:nucleoside-diphosphate-sugar epimerase
LRRVGDGRNRIDMVYVDNAAAAHLQAADRLGPESPVGGRAYFITQGEPVNCWQWINAVLRLAGLPEVTKSISFPLAWRMGGMFESVYGFLGRKGDPPMTRFLAAQLARSHFYSIRRAQEDFGYHPHVSTEEGMRRLAAVLER